MAMRLQLLDGSTPVTDASVVTEPLPRFDGREEAITGMHVGSGIYLVDPCMRPILRRPRTVSIFQGSYEPQSIGYVDNQEDCNGPVHDTETIYVRRRAAPAPARCGGSHQIGWEMLDRRRLPDGDELTVWITPSRWGGVSIALVNGAEVDWWKGLSICNQTTRRDAEPVLQTERPGSSAFVRLIPPTQQRPGVNPLRGSAAILWKAKFLGTREPVYELPFDPAPVDLNGKWIQFTWHRQ